MHGKAQRMIALFSLILLLASMIVVPNEAEAASAFYGEYTDVAKITDYNSCPSIQGIAVGSQMIYTVKINGDDTQAFITMTDKDTGETTRLYNKDAGSYMFNYLDHANDMDVWGIDGKSHLFVATTKQGANAIVRLKRDGSNLTKVGTYHLKCDGADICATAMAIKSVSGGQITFITKWGMDLYTGSVSISATNATINMTKICTISKDKVYIKGEYLDLSSFVNQGMGYHNGVLYVPITGDDNWLERSVVMVFNLDGVITGSTIRPSDAIVFRVTSGAYSALFEIESCDISTGDNKLYFGVQRRKSSSDTNHDGIASFDGYTFAKLTAPADYKKFVVQYNANGGSGTMSNTTVPYGVSTALRKNTFTKDGSKFVGWTAYRTTQKQWYYTNGSSTGWYAEGSQPSGYTKYIYKDGVKVAKTSGVDGDVVKLYAQWEPSTYTVRYDANGGSGTMADTTVTYGVSTKLRANAFTKPGCSFIGWHAYRTAQNQWYYTDGTSYGWYAEGSQPAGYYKDIYADQASVAKTTGMDGDVVIMYAQWEGNAPLSPYEYYLFGWINGANYGCEEDSATLGQYRFENGKLTTTFAQDSYIGVKKVDISFGTEVVGWFMTDGWQGYVNSATLYRTDTIFNADKLYVPGGVPVTFTIQDPDNGTLSISYETGSAQCTHSYQSDVTTAATCTATGIRTYTCTKCGHWYSETLPSTGHNFANGSCSFCGVSDGSVSQPETYYLVGWINGADYGCESDYENNGIYKFVNGQLTARFNSDSYVFVKTEDNGSWFLADSYVQTPPCTFIEGGTEKLFVPGGVELIFTLVENADGSVTVSYTQTSTPECSHSYVSQQTTAPTCTTTGILTYTCTKCGYNYTQSVAATGHYFVDNRCTFCGMADPNANPATGTDYYLAGFINGADYGYDSDWQNLGQYRFVDGKLAATFTQDSYILVKKADAASSAVLDWYMTDGWQGYVTSATLYTATSIGNPDKLYVPGGVPVTFTLEDHGNGSLTLSYASGSAQCAHRYQTNVMLAPTCTASGVYAYTCTQCGHWYSQTVSATGHNFINGSCSFCGVSDGSAGQSETYYLVGWINEADYGCEADWQNNGIYKFVNGQLTVKFNSASYVFVKTEGNGRWLLADSYTQTSPCIFKEGGTEKMFVPGGVELILTLVENADGSVTVSYTQGSTSECDHSYIAEVTATATCTTTGIRTYTCTECGHSYTQSIAATGHNFFGNQCTLCGMADPNPGSSTGTEYYLVGYINGADYGCEWDWQNLGQYRFVDGRLTATFTEDSYVFVKTGDNQEWLMTNAYCEASTCTFVEGGYEKMFIPGNVELTFALTENTDGSVTLTYTTGSTSASTLPTLTLKAPTLEFKDMIRINAFYTAENIQDVVEMGMITYDTQVSRWSIRTADHVIPGAVYDSNTGRYYCGSQGIHGKYLADTVYLAAYAKMSDGSYVYSKLAPYSPLTYANSQLRNSTDMKMKQLVVAMLEYGAQAQLFFGHNTGNLANANLTAEQLALPESYRADMTGNVPAVSAAKQGAFANNAGFASRYPSISFEGAFCINYFFTPKYVPDSGITLYYWNAEDYNAVSVLTTSNATGKFKLEGSGSGEYRGEITGIAAKALSEAVYVSAAYKSGGVVWTSGVLGYSIGAYCSSQASKGSTIADLAMATAVYGYHAKAYFG